jgi:hypothetical protein
MTLRGDSPPKLLLFGIPIDAGYREIARLWWGDVRTSIKHGHRDLTPQDRARTELVLALAERLRAEGVPRPFIEAWNRIGTPDPKIFPQKLKPGQPLGNLASEAIWRQFRPLVFSRLRHFGAVENKDAVQAAQLALLEARADYNPAIDGSVGTYATEYHLIDNAIKEVLYGKDADAYSARHERLSGDEVPYDNSYEGDQECKERWESVAKTLFPAWLDNAIDFSRDGAHRFTLKRFPVVVGDKIETRVFPFWLQLWVSETKSWKRIIHGGVARDETKTDLDFKWSAYTILNFLAYGGELFDTDGRSVKVGKPLSEYPKGAAIRRPMRDPPPPRELKLVRHCSPGFGYRRNLEEIWAWPRQDAEYPNVHGLHAPQGRDHPGIWPPTRLTAQDIGKIRAGKTVKDRKMVDTVTRVGNRIIFHETEDTGGSGGHNPENHFDDAGRINLAKI